MVPITPSRSVRAMQYAVLLITLTWCCCFGQQETPESKLLSYKQYARIQHDVPYVLEFKVGNGALLLFGCQHAFNPADPQIADIEKEWDRFKPDVAYNEGGNPPSARTRKDAVERYAEPGLVRFLAAQHGVPVATFEPHEVDEIKELRKKYSDEQIKVFYLLRAYLSFRQSKHEQTDDAYMTQQLSLPHWKEKKLGHIISTTAELQGACQRLFKELKDWKQVSDDWFDPTKEGQYTNDLQNDSGMFRDRHIFQLLTRRAQRGDRVFAVIGASHVPAMEPALQALLGAPQRKRDGAKVTTR